MIRLHAPVARVWIQLAVLAAAVASVLLALWGWRKQQSTQRRGVLAEPAPGTLGGMHPEVFMQMFGGRGEDQARKYLPRLSDAGVVPEVLGWVDGGVVLRRGLPLPDWVAGAEPADVVALRPLLIDLLQRLHAEGVCHRDLHWENVVIVGGAPFVIDLEHACDVDPAGPCYDLTGPFAGVPLLPAHAQFEGILGTQGMWWDAAWDRRWGGRYRPLGQVFGPLRAQSRGSRG